MPHSGVWRKMMRVSIVKRFHEANQIGWVEFRPDRPHPEERASLARVSKDGRRRDLCGRPSRRAQERALLDEADEGVDMIRNSETPQSCPGTARISDGSESRGGNSQRRRECALEADEVAETAHPVGEFGTAQQRMEGAAQPAAPQLFCCGIIHSFHDLAQTAPADAVFALGKPDLPRFADQIGQRDRAELPRIRARVSIVAE
jgi:hypothetical protein